MNTFVVANPNKCIGCKSCEIACAAAHLDVNILTAGAAGVPFSPRINLIRAEKVTVPIQCRQCDDSPCANVCPVGAIVHQENKIVVKTELCIGCKICMLACPFGTMDMAPQYKNSHKQTQTLQTQTLNVITKEESENKEVMAAHKCDLCAGIPEGPACVEVCPADAFVIVSPEVINNSIKNKRQSNALELLENKSI